MQFPSGVSKGDGVVRPVQESSTQTRCIRKHREGIGTRAWVCKSPGATSLDPQPIPQNINDLHLEFWICVATTSPTDVLPLPRRRSGERVTERVFFLLRRLDRVTPAQSARSSNRSLIAAASTSPLPNQRSRGSDLASIARAVWRAEFRVRPYKSSNWFRNAAIP